MSLHTRAETVWIAFIFDMAEASH